jgi:hypothetical protein
MSRRVSVVNRSSRVSARVEPNHEEESEEEEEDDEEERNKPRKMGQMSFQSFGSGGDVHGCMSSVVRRS